MNDSNINSSRFDEHADRMTALEKEVAALTQENRELKDLLQKLDTEEIYAHRIYKQVKDKFDSENDNQQKFNNPLLTAVISIVIALSGNTAFFGILQASITEGVKTVQREGDRKVKAVEQQVEQAAEDAVKIVKREGEQEVEAVEQKVKKAATEAANATTEKIDEKIKKNVSQAVKKEVKEKVTNEINTVVESELNKTITPEKVKQIVEEKVKQEMGDTQTP